MATLTITVISEDDEDYDGNPVTVKIATGDLDGEALKESISCDGEETDTGVKTAFKAKLTEKGYVWDTEA